MVLQERQTVRVTDRLGEKRSSRSPTRACVLALHCTERRSSEMTSTPGRLRAPIRRVPRQRPRGRPRTPRFTHHSSALALHTVYIVRIVACMWTRRELQIDGSISSTVRRSSNRVWFHHDDLLIGRSCQRGQHLLTLGLPQEEIILESI